MLYSAASGSAAAREALYFLHALRYTTGLEVFETDMSEWATEGWKWQRASSGGSVSEV